MAPSATCVDFYRLQGKDLVQAVCLIAGKAYQAGYHVRIFATEKNQLEELDSRLWSYRPGSFVPHARRENRDPHFPEPVILADDCTPSEGAQVLIALTPPRSECLASYLRVIELVPPDPEGRAAARRRYATYREAGYPLRVHDLTVN